MCTGIRQIANLNSLEYNLFSIPLYSVHTHPACVLSRFSRVQLFATLWTVAHQAPLSMEFSRQEYLSWLLFPSLGNPPNPVIKTRSLALQADSLPTKPSGKSSAALSTVQFSSVQPLSRVRLCDPMNRSMPGLPVHHQLSELTQTVHPVSDAIQPSHPLPYSSPPAFSLSQHQGLFQ